MKFAHFFVDRPIFASVLSIVIVIIGLVAYASLPVAQYPEIAPPTIVVRASYPGANAETVAATVATPLEQEINGVEDMLYTCWSRTASRPHCRAAGRGPPPRRHHPQELARPHDGRAHAALEP
jgi:hydrophobic/amphiphilic exporter-1 (mainly G- bacteria), HAE1 family